MLDKKSFGKLAAFSLFALALTGCARQNALLQNKNTVTSIQELPELLKSEPAPLAYAHNDYKHSAPLFDALKNGFMCAEADIFLRHQKLVVAHTSLGIDTAKTLDKLYCDQLSRLRQENGGHISPNSTQSFLLLIDVKEGGIKIHQALREMLEKYKPMLTSFDKNGVVREGAVTVIVSGNRPPEKFIEEQDERLAAYDGRLWDIRKNRPFMMSCIPIVSANWNKSISWHGKGQMPEKKRQKLMAIVKSVHDNGKQIRFWATPEGNEKKCENVWKELIKAKVDYIGTDHLPWLQTFLLKHTPPVLPQPTSATYTVAM